MVWLLNFLKSEQKTILFSRLVISVVVLIYIILLIVARVDCRTKTSTPSIHSSRVVSTAEGLTSSCAVFEEGVPVCQDPDEPNTYAILQVYSLDRITYTHSRKYYRSSIAFFYESLIYF